MSRFPAGDTAFETFVRETGPGLLRFGHVLTVDRSAAEDLAQETFIRVGLAWARVRADGNPVGYAQRTMVNLFLNQRRRRTEVPVAALPAFLPASLADTYLRKLARIGAAVARFWQRHAFGRDR